jgi:hypothetical protein
MLRFLLTLQMLGCVIAFAAEPIAPALDVQTRQRLTQVADEALRDHEITQEQRTEAVRWFNSSPCRSVQRRAADSRRSAIASAIAREQKQEKIRIFEYFAYQGWTIVFTDAGPGDEPYMFYRTDPARGVKPVAMWAGAATIFETSDLVRWATENAPGIPLTLASCFAWQVTLAQ